MSPTWRRRRCTNSKQMASSPRSSLSYSVNGKGNPNNPERVRAVPPTDGFTHVLMCNSPWIQQVGVTNINNTVSPPTRGSVAVAKKCSNVAACIARHRATSSTLKNQRRHDGRGARGMGVVDDTTPQPGPIAFVVGGKRTGKVLPVIVRCGQNKE